MFGPGAFRLFLASMVLLSHVSAGRFGVVAVMVFFILSGYWVTRMYAEKYSRNPAPVQTFYLARVLRLWPPFAIAILAAILLRDLRGEVAALNQLTSLTMLGVASGARDPLQITWSLDIELQFYILLPILIALAASHRSPFLQAGAVLAASAFAWISVYVFKIETAIQYLPAFAAGMAIFLHDIRVSRRTAMWSVATFLVIGAFLLSNDYTAGTIYEVPMNRRAVRFVSMFWALSLVPFVAWNVRQAAGRFDRHMGDLSYSLYLVHYPVIQTVDWATVSETATDAAVARIAASFLVALLFYVIVDRSFEHLRVRIMRQKPAARAF